ncbi:ankyrin repeat-containing domain protein [Annulohypoxylon truncatum]|uniref:ankyrin repeat-containing domain protein n=1 Tax=Annulohypoxylon truncatum TaxID=327061 RepID=UPI0020088565|nr:ankyrin repeat-containing domain protein [Annulohypoxylon truncatum]KAI1213089.1 ankyrin repeat-containing domain protein [Annulohypoxylon truncatum]
MASITHTTPDAGPADSSSQKDLNEDSAKSSRDDGPSEETSNFPKNEAAEPVHTSRNSDGDATKSRKNSIVEDTEDKDDEVQRPWKDLEDYMVRRKPPEYDAEGLVTLWNAQYDTSPEPASYMAADFDIVVVHGLRGARRPPWENPGAGSSIWLYDQGRYGGRKVMSFGYSISKIMCGIYTYQVIMNVAKRLLDDLERSIMLIAHDIGGTIVKCALALAELNPRSYGDIFDSSRVLVFYGCLHRTTDILEMEDRLSKFLYGHILLEGPTPPPLVNSTRHLAEAIMSINALFTDSKQMFLSSILSIYSDVDESLIDKIYDGFTGTLGIPFEIRVPGGLKDDRGLIEKNLNGVNSSANVDRSLRNNQRLLASIASPPLPLRTAAGPTHPYSWVTENEVYQSWYTQRGPSLLYLDGKSDTQAASEYIFGHLDNLSLSKDDDWFVLYFTFNRYDVRRHKIEDMLTTFLAQMCGFLQSPDFDWLEDIRVHRGWKYMDLLDLLSLYYLCINRRRVSCVINNFDDCEPLSRKTFLSSIYSFSENQNMSLKAIVTSHIPGALLEELSSWSVLNLDAAAPTTENEITADSFDASLQRQRPEARAFKTQFEEELKVIAALKPEVRGLVLDHVRRNEHWPLHKSIENILGPIEEMSHKSVIKKILNNVPDKELVFRALSWILYATRPLTPWELTTAITIGIERSGLEEQLRITQSANKFLCKLLAWFSGIIALDHNEIIISTRGVREILMTDYSYGPKDFDAWSISGRGAHIMIARTCLAYLTRPGTKGNLEAFYNDSLYNNSHVAIVDDRTTLQNYAVRFWMHHLSLASIDHEPTDILTSFSKSEIVPYWSRAYWVLANPFTRSRQPRESLYPHLASTGLFLQAENWCNKDEDLSEGLIEACLNGALQTFRDLLLRRKHSEEVLTEALVGAGAYGDKAILIELVEYITKNYRSFSWDSQKTIVARASFLGLDEVLVRLLEAGCPIDVEVPGASRLVTPLHLAVRVNNINGAKLLLERGANSNHVNKFKWTSLHLASFRGYLEMAKLLVRYAADPDAQDEYLQSPLHNACVAGHSRLVEFLVELYANLDMKNPNSQNEPSWSPLALSVVGNNIECVRILLGANADPEIPTPYFGTPLACAVNYGCLDISRLLLVKGVNPNHELIKPPILHLAIGSKDDRFRLGIVKLLIEMGARVNADDINGNAALHLACWSDDPRKLLTVEYLLEQGADVNHQNHDGIVPLHIAVSKDDVRLSQLLLDHHNNVLETATRTKFTPLVLALKSEQMTRMLLERGADPNTRPDGDEPALFYAVRGDHKEAVRLLVQYGAQIDPPNGLRDDTKWEPMKSAVFYGQEDIIRILAEGGADVNRRFSDGSTLILTGLNSTGLRALLEFRPKVDVQDNDGNAPLHYIYEQTPLENVKLLVRAGSDINLTGYRNQTPLCEALRCGHEEAARYYLSRKADVNILSPVYGGSLHTACSAGLVDLVPELLKAGADVNLVADEFVGTPLSSIFIQYYSIESSYEKKSQLINILFNAGADPMITGGLFGNVAGAAALGGNSIHLGMLASKGVSFLSVDGMGRQPLHMAAVHGDRDIVSFILDAGGNVTDKDKIGRNAISWAAQGGSIEILDDLLHLTGDDVINEPDIDGWTPLYWVARGIGNEIQHAGGNQYDTIKMLLGRGADRTIKSSINGREYTPAIIARYHSCGSDILELLIPGDEKDRQLFSDKSPTPPKHRRLNYHLITCDFCLFSCYGLRYKCRTCMDFDLCYKCYNSKDKLHFPDHEFEEFGPEFDMDEVASHSRSSSPGSSPDEASSSSDPDSDGESGNESVTSPIDG